jgi:hypothetical protein
MAAHMTKKPPARRTAAVAVRGRRSALLTDVRELIIHTREGVARTVDSGLTALYWHIGQRIRRDILNEKRADYGAKVVAELGRKLEKEFGRGFAEKNLRRMVQFAEVFPDRKIVVSLIHN